MEAELHAIRIHETKREYSAGTLKQACGAKGELLYQSVGICQTILWYKF